MEPAAVFIVVITLAVGTGLIVMLCMPSEDELCIKRFRKQLQQMAADQWGRTGQQTVKVKVIKARLVTTLANLNARRVLYQEITGLAERRAGTLFGIQRTLVTIYNTALSELAQLELPEGEKTQFRLVLEQTLADGLRNVLVVTPTPQQKKGRTHGRPAASASPPAAAAKQ